MPDAARVGDKHTCTNPNPAAHVGGPVAAPCSPNVETNSLAQGRATDLLDCTPVNLKNFIVTGSSTVEINGKLAARKTDKTMHPPPGEIVEGSPNVEIGGGAAGVTLGNPDAGRIACQNAAAGRTSGATQQSYQNCGIESSRQIINQATGGNMTEDALLDDAMNNGDAANERNRADSGGSSPDGRERVLDRNGVPSSRQTGSMDNIMQAVAEGRGVITSHDVSVLWGPGNAGGHAVMVTGVEYDASGNPTRVIYNDTGTGQCATSVPAAQFQSSLRPGRDINVTDNPIF